MGAKPQGIIEWRLVPNVDGDVYAPGRGERLATVIPLLWDNAKLTIAVYRPLAPEDELFGFDQSWDYPSVEEAVDALHAWDGQGFPPGDWTVYHPATGVKQRRADLRVRRRTPPETVPAR